MMQKILFKDGINALSNMATYAIEKDGEIWVTVEHAYQAAKFDDVTLKNQIKNARSAYDAKRIADEHISEIRPGWVDARLPVMEELIRFKSPYSPGLCPGVFDLEQHPHVRKRLLKSIPAEIIEDTDDAFWGRGQNGEGENQLGKLWMKLRDAICSD